MSGATTLVGQAYLSDLHTEREGITAARVTVRDDGVTGAVQDEGAEGSRGGSSLKNSPSAALGLGLDRGVVWDDRLGTSKLVRGHVISGVSQDSANASLELGVAAVDRGNTQGDRLASV